MKRLIILCLIVFLVISEFTFVLAEEQSLFEIKINEQVLAIPVEMGKSYIDETGRTQIPARAIIEGLGFVVGWDNENQTVLILDQDNNSVATLQINSKIVNLADGTTIEMDTEAVVGVDGRTYIPLRFVSEALGFDIPQEGGYKFENGIHKINIVATEDIIQDAKIDVKIDDIVDATALYLYTQKDYRGVQGTGKYATWEYGFIDRQGNTIIEPQFDKAFDFSEGLALVGVRENQGDTNSYKYGYINKSGEFVIEAQYNKATKFSEGLASVAMGSDREVKQYFIDKKGNVVFEVPYERLNFSDFFSEGLVAADLEEKKDVYLNTHGEIVIDMQGDLEHRNKFSEGLALVEKVGIGDNWGYIDKTGEFNI